MWHADLFAIQTQSCPMAQRDKLRSFCTLLSSRSGEPDDMWRQIMVAHLFAIQRRLCPMARRDKLWSFCAFSSRLDHDRWHAETNYGHFAPFCHPEAIVPDDMRRQIMVILCPLTFRSSESSDKRAETNYGHSAPFFIQEQRVEW